MQAPRRATTSLVCVPLIALMVVAGCSGGDDPTQPSPTTGSLVVDVQGLPDGTNCIIGIVGPAYYANSLEGSATLEGLAPGEYSLTFSSPIDGYFRYEPDAAAEILMVAAGEAATVTVTYAGVAARGHLDVNLTGLPSGTAGAALVTGPSGYQRTLTASTRLESLLPGSYDVTATAVTDGSFLYVPSPETGNVSVAVGQTATRIVTYGQEALPDVDFSVTGIEIVQSTQREDSSVPLIRSREALVRVYVQSTADTPWVPDVQLEIFIDGDAVAPVILTPDYDAVPQATERGDLANSVNWILPAAYVQPGLTLRATVDPEDAFLETDDTNNAFPSAETTQGQPVASVDPFRLTLVPVQQSANGLTGEVSASNADDYSEMAATLYPMPSVYTSVRATYTTDAPALQSNDGNGAWNTILQEVQLLRQADDSDDNYFGVVQTTYGSGIAGLGYIPGSRSSSYRAAIGWDRTNSRSGVAAHELGHNLGRYHAACGGASGTDSAYPYPGASIGQWGYDARSGELVDPTSTTDIMGYCNPQWISDYNFELILGWLDGVVTPRAIDTGAQPCLLVWGRIEDGNVTLDPAVVIEARPSLPERAGDYRVDVVADDGRPLVDLSFDPPRVGCAEGDQSSFVWLVPIDVAEAEAIETVAVAGRGSVAVQHARTADITATRRIPMALDRTTGGRASLRWDATSLPLAVVRDAADGTVLAIGRHGDLDFDCDAARLDVAFSDGTRTLHWSRTLD